MPRLTPTPPQGSTGAISAAQAPVATDDSTSGPSASGPSGLASVEEVDGIVLPSAIDWLEFWGEAGREIPRQRTFVNFYVFSNSELERILF